MRTSPFLRELMETFLKVGGRRGKAGGPGIDFDELGVSEVQDLLERANMNAVLADFGDRNQQEDPVMHFFEGFLQAYDAKIKKGRGVFYTPHPVVSYIVRSVDELLQTEFGLVDGLADTTTWGEMCKSHKDLQIPQGTSSDQAFVQILDPATGTGTFIVEVIDIIYKTMTAKWAGQNHGEKKIESLWNEYVPKHLLPRLHAYELMMAPYAIAHLKVGLKLKETGYGFGSDERARIYLTNALEPAQDFSGTFEFAIPALAHEAHAVNEVKRNQRFTVVIGNPPYAGVSSNEGPWIENLLRSPLSDGAASYFTFNGAPLDEPNTRWLNDDYVKFLRLAQAEVANSKIGIAGLITNHSWFENPTFRGMRQSTTQTFPQIYLLDLHGNTKKKETTPDGSKDENVFDIQQGVAISLLVSRDVDTSIRHADLFGLRIEKYGELQRSSVGTTHWHSLTPDPALMLWRRFDATNSDEYESYPVITDIFSAGGGDGRGSSWAKGLATTKDHLFISFDRAEAFEKIGLLASTTASDSHVGDTLSLEDTPYFTIADARRAIRKGDWKARVCSVTYRPFDTRVLYWHPELYDVGRGASSKRVMSHLFKPNIALVTSRMTKGESFAHTFVTRFPVEVIFLSSKTSNNAFVFPLKYYPDLSSQMGLGFDQAHFRTNLNPTFLRRLAQSLGLNVAKDGLPAGLTPEDIFHYAYAVFHSPGYRSRYAEFLKIDFPRLPLTGNLELFRALARLGGELTALHLLESPKLDKSITEFTGGRNPEVEKISWTRNTVWVDKAQTTGFHGVREDVWNFHIGGYQVCEKWLKDRKGRKLSKEDIAHYQKIVVALSETIRLMKEIDEVIVKHGGWPGAFQTNSVSPTKEPAKENAVSNKD
jgi:predicted helicase